jgi:hypothetical protein
MPDFNSPNFNKKLTQPKPQPQQQPLREFNVGLPEDGDDEIVNPAVLRQQAAQQPVQQKISPAEFEARMKAAREEKNDVLKHGARITDHGKRRIELLSGIGRLTRDVQIGDTVFSLRTLKSQESREAGMATLENVKNDYEAALESRKQQLIRSIYKIDGEDINMVLGDNTDESKLALIDSLEEVIVGRLWDELAAMKEEARTKYGMTTPKAVEEVSADLKK